MRIEDVLSSFLSKEEIANVLTGRTGNAGGTVLTAVGLFGAGLLLGAGLALLLTPTSGQEVRQDLAERLSEVGHRGGNGGEAAGDTPDQRS